MSTVSRDGNKAFQGTWTKGISARPEGDRVILFKDGKEVATFAADVDPRIVDQFCTFAQTATDLTVANLPDGPPRVFITLDQEHLNSRGGHGETIVTVEVTRPEDSKVSRFHLMVAALDRGGISADLRSMRRNSDVVRSVNGSFVDWEG